jgi:hypothetical protein
MHVFSRTRIHMPSHCYSSRKSSTWRVKVQRRFEQLWYVMLMLETSRQLSKPFTTPLTCSLQTKSLRIVKDFLILQSRCLSDSEEPKREEYQQQVRKVDPWLFLLLSNPISIFL